MRPEAGCEILDLTLTQRIRYSQSEHTVDAVVHIVGVTCGMVAAVALASMILERGERTYAAGLGIYAFGLLTMFICSALYNMAWEGWWKALLAVWIMRQSSC